MWQPVLTMKEWLLVLWVPCCNCACALNRTTTRICLLHLASLLHSSYMTSNKDEKDSQGEGWGEEVKFRQAFVLFNTSGSSGSSNTNSPVELQPLGNGWQECSITFGAILVERLHENLSSWLCEKLEQKVSLHQLSFFTHIINLMSQGLLSLLCLGTHDCWETWLFLSFPHILLILFLLHWSKPSQF